LCFSKGMGETNDLRQAIVLQNLTHPFVRPCVLDVKLGTQLYDEDASPEKARRMEEVSRATTTGTTGLRLTGFQVNFCS
jgi:1D-myo-inositol-tetrakisphosphate 5-kinase/inositol-polyphosphate multikinase